MPDGELTRLLGLVIERLDEQSARMATKDDLADLERRMATKDDLADLERRMAAKDDLNDFRREFKNELDAAVVRLEAKIDGRAEQAAHLIQVDRREISELRGAVDMLGKRFDALVRPAAE